MENKLIDGKQIAQDIRNEVKTEVAALTQKYGRAPGLTVVLVGENPASQVYVRNKGKACDEVGIKSVQHNLPADTPEEKLLALVEELNNDPTVDGILVQLPLPDQIDEKKVLNKIDPLKDVDGFHPVNVGKLVVGEKAFRPCTPAGVQELLIRSGAEIEGSNVVIVGRSNIVGKPVALILMQKAKGANATVTVCHSRSKNLAEICARADILIAAIGSPEFIKADMVKAGAVVIDVGVNRVDDPAAKKGYKLVGDVAFDEVIDKVKLITPVPGGVGPMTIAMLMKNTLESFKMRMAGK